MGIKIELVPGEHGTAYPLPTQTTLECDDGSSILCKRSATYRTGNYVDDRSAATRDGWLERQDSKRGRIFICMDCRRA